VSDVSAPEPWRGQVNRWLGIVVLHAAYRVAVIGRHRVPSPGQAVLFVCNHAGFIDGPLLPSLAPRPTSVLVKREMFRGPLGWLLRFLGHIPVQRGSADRTAKHTALAVLARGGAVGIFPEGTRGRGDVSSVQHGAAWLALQSGAVVVPVAFLGTRATGASRASLPRLRSRMVMEFGAPVELAVDPSATGRERLRAATEQVRDVLASHVRESQERHQVFLPEDDPR
jgi:1-acyl-sn-glycerol-3-phosphate acyltransferase